MRSCLIYDNSLKFSRAAYGILALIAFLIQNSWLILIVGILMLLGAISVNYNFFYQLYSQIIKKLLKDRSGTVEKESGELTFSQGVAGFLFLGAFLLLYFNKLVGLGWGLVLIDAFLLLLACFSGVCVASLMYAVFKKKLLRSDRNGEN